MKYAINLVKEDRIAEKRELAKSKRLFIYASICFGLLGLSFIYSVFEVLSMQRVLWEQEERLTQIETRYKKYKSTKMIVQKSDIELLNRLQSNRIFWTKKLAAMALHLPEKYRIIKFAFDGEKLTVSGYGYITPDQEQLVVLNKYLNSLREDKTYSDDFKATTFGYTERNDEKSKYKVKRRVTFEFSSTKHGMVNP